MIYTWNFSPFIIDLPYFQLRWYTLSFILSFIIGYFWLNHESKKLKNGNGFAEYGLFILVGSIVSLARLFHVLFYKWDYYQNNLTEIFQLQMGGLSSHGGVIGMLVGSFIFGKFVAKKSSLWMIDKLAVPLVFGAGLIRLGNFFNQEIVGIPTNANFGIVFPKVDALPRHPAQLYEAICYILGAVILFLFLKKQDDKPNGYAFGLGVFICFASRFFIEFVKSPLTQVADSTFLTMGQWLTIPIIAISILLIKGRFNRL